MFNKPSSLKHFLNTILIFVFCTWGIAQERPAPKQANKELKLERKLEKEVSLKLKNGSLKQLVEYLKTNYDIKLQLHKSSRLTLDEKITFEFQNTRLRTALDLFLETFDCTYRIKDDFLIFLSEEEAENHVRVKVYPVRDILKMIEDEDPELAKQNQAQASRSKPKTVFSAEARYELTYLIETIISPDSWESTEGLGNQRILNGLLIVGQTEKVHVKLQKFLDNLRKHMAQKPAQKNGN